LRGRTIGKIFQLKRSRLVIDFRPGDGRYLLMNFEPTSTPRLYLVRRRVKDLEKQSENAGNFVLFIRKHLANAQLNNISKDENDRIVRFVFLAQNEDGEMNILALVAQFTGRAANLYLLDVNGVILDSLRDGQAVGEVYTPPVSDAETRRRGDADNVLLLSKLPLSARHPVTASQEPPSPLSEKLDAYFLKRDEEHDFQQVSREARSNLKQELARKEKLLSRLQFDLTRHGKAQDLKKYGDLLLASAVTARREGNRAFVTDFFDENAPEIMIEADENLTLPEAAEKYFAKYAKARNAAVELTDRIANLEISISQLKTKQTELEKLVEAQNLTALNEFAEANGLLKTKPEIAEKPKSKKEPEITSGVRRYRSSDGMEILVGRNSKDNDYLTMRVAKSLDWWLHAADYPGSHVVVRNPSKKELPTKTLLEAAQLAAKFSQARTDSKVAVHYTQRKFINKQKNAPPGQVRLASFRTILVEPMEAGQRILQ
jgi:predicted ribosome quality control (RQC) complex YloA/Tae2 family protein